MVRVSWLILFLALGSFAAAQEPGTADPPVAFPGDTESDDGPTAPAKVDVEPEARDSQIEQRLQGILEATEWFESPQVEVREGVVFLTGSTHSEQYKDWAGNLARNTQDVAAVVNRIELQSGSAWDLSPAWAEVGNLWRNVLLSLPFILFGIIILALAWWIARVATNVGRRLFLRGMEAPLLREVLARGVGLLVFLLGLYIVLRVSGLTRLAVTVLGGTGLIGLVIGIAFRDITENFLASIFLSMQRPFRPGDLVEISGDLGFVQRLTVRTTILMTLDGNHVQIPNSTVYKSSIRNFTSNPNRRESFLVGIGYDDVIAHAQQAALDVLANHPAVLKDPEPWVLVDSLGASTVNLKVYFWVDGVEHSWLKVRSSVIRLVKRAFQSEGISMPDEAREVVFPQGVTVDLIRRRGEEGPRVDGGKRSAQLESTTASTKAEGGLASEAGQIEQQARRSRPPEGGEDLLGE